MTPQFDPEAHYENIGQTLSQYPQLLGVIMDSGIPEDTMNSQIQALQSPNATLATFENILSVQDGARLRYLNNTEIAEMEVEDRNKIFMESKDHYMFTINNVWEFLTADNKQHVFDARNISKESEVDSEVVSEYLKDNPVALHLENNKTFRQHHRKGVQKLAAYFFQDTSYSAYDAVERAANALYGWMTVGRDTSNGSYHGLKTKDAKEYDISPDQIVFGARRFVAEVLANVKDINDINIPGLSNEEKQYFVKEAFQGSGSIQVDAAPSQDGKGWVAVFKKYNELPRFFINDYEPTEIIGIVEINGEPQFRDTKDIQRMALSEEIVSALYQIYELPGPRFGGSTIWEDLMTHQEEYLGSETKPPTKGNLSPQQMMNVQRDRGLAFLGNIMSFSKAQVDFVIRPMIEHYKNQRRSTPPTDDELRTYINKELKRHGSFTSKMAEYFKGAPFMGSWLDDDFYEGIQENPDFDPTRAHFTPSALKETFPSWPMYPNTGAVH